MNAPMEEMALIRKELKAIVIDINQITRTDEPTGQFFSDDNAPETGISPW